tara:strand:+ start:1111 stop:1617 length:507 start_codon:yes stop_codon:yes gene_type:complete
MDLDLKHIQTLLENIKPFPKVTNRKPLNKFKTSGGNHKQLNCIHLGVKYFGKKYNQTKATKEKIYPDLERSIITFIQKYYPNIKYNQILINKNNWFNIHKDKNNKIDKALLIGLGDYAGGELNLHDDNGTIIKRVDIRMNPIIFANKTISHSVQHWTGDRYSIITYLI